MVILAQGTKAWNAWRTRHPDFEPDLSTANLSRANLPYAKLSRVDLWQAKLAWANLPRVDLSRANLSQANLHRADLSGADLSHADLTDAKLSRANLSDANLSNAKVSYAKLSDAKLSRANLSNADLSDADLSNADLSNADLSNTRLTDAVFSNADLRDANLAGADLDHAVFFHANLSRANLSQAEMGGATLIRTIFANVDLSAATGLDAVEHSGPSTIGVDTLFRSNGNIPEVFLRGAGVPDSFVTYVKSLVGSAIEFYSCFISYSTYDQEFANRLHTDLQAKGVRCWFAPHDIQGGRKIHEQIDEAIRVYDKLLLILSSASMNSNWVKTEIANARNREEEQKRQMLFPVTVVPFEQVRAWKLPDADTGLDSAREIREYFIPDFSTWKDHDSYQKAFNRLLKDLKATGQHQA